MLLHARAALAPLSIAMLAACARKTIPANPHAEHMAPATAAAPSASTTAQEPDSLTAPSAETAKASLAASPRHGEWVMIPAGQSSADSVRAWVVYPERSTKAPVIIVVHEIFGMSTWIRAVTDQLAANGFIAIAPDLLTGKYTPQPGVDTLSADSAVALIRTLNPSDIGRRLSAVAKYGTSLPAALPHYGIVGFCWGGSVAFAYAAATPGLGAAVVYYGTSPSADDLKKLHAPVLGLYGQKDERTTATVAPADSVLKSLGKTYDYFIFPGAGHGFLRAQNSQNGANKAAAEQAWPKTIAWFRKYLGA